MANRRRDPVSYRPFRAEPLLAEGLLAVSRPGGELLERVAAGMNRLADEAGRRADAEAERAGRLAGQQAALAGRTQISVPEAGRAAGGQVTAGATGDHYSLAAEILRHEEGFRETPYWDVNALRTGYGSDTVTLPDGSVQRVTGDTRVSRDDAERDLSRRLREFERVAAGQVGADTWQRLPASTRAGLLSVTYNYGSLPKSVRAAVRTGDVGRIAEAVGGLSSNRERRRREASIIAGSIDPTPTASTDEGTSASAQPAEPTVAGGSFRPSRRNTIFGRAFDEAGTRTYLAALETEMRSTTAQLFDQHKDDPAALERSFRDLRGALARDHVFDEIRADYEIGFDRLADTYINQARENLSRRLEAEDRASFIERGSALETDIQKRIADFDPRSPQAADAIASAQAAVDQHYDSAVDRGIMDPDDAERAKITSRRETALQFYRRQAEVLDADGIASMRREMESDFTEGQLEGLDGEGWKTLSAGLEKLEASKRREASRLANGLRRRGDQMAARIAGGFEIDQAELSQLMSDAGTTPDGKEAVQETLAKISAGRAIRDFDVRRAEAHVAGLRRQYGDAPTDPELRTLAFAEKMLATKKKAIATDPLAYAETQGIVPETPLLTEAESADQVAEIMAARSLAADEAATALGTRPRYLKAGEAKAIAAAVKQDPAGGVAIAGAIVAGSGDRANDVLAEFGQDAPMIAEAGAIVAFGGSARAAEDVILGYGKTADGKSRKGLKPEAARESFRAVAGSSLTFAPQDANRIQRAADAISRTRLTEEGLDPSSDEARLVHDQAVQEAAGAVFDRGIQYGGFATIGSTWFSDGARVLVPSDIRADRFGDLVASLQDSDLETLRIKPKRGFTFAGRGGALRVPRGLAATLKDAVPVAVAGGYAFAMGDPASEDPQFIQGEDGKIFVLDILSLRDRLEPRVPGAFR